ncbi:MAG: sulfur carrier protein ThiS [Gammaproteobacteria bacterium]
MYILVNGKQQVLDADTLAQAMTELGFNGTGVATALNGEFVPASGRSEQTLTDGDRLEIVAPLQGG